MRINKENTRINQTGFTLLEVTVVVIIISILLGFTMALVPRQQELRQYKKADREMDKILDAIIGFAQVNGRLPCPSPAASAGVSSGGGNSDCATFSGFVPWDTLGIQGLINKDSLLADPWGNPYRYYVPGNDANGDGNADFTFAGQMKEIGLGDRWDVETDPDNPTTGTDTYIDLDGQFVICDAATTTVDICDGGAAYVFGDPTDSNGNPTATKGPYTGAIVVLLSTGKNGNQTPTGDELENMGSTAAGQYFLKNNSTVLGVRETTFVKRTTGFADDFDDIIKWIPPSILFSKMIEAGQLP
ncbi:MAG: prepilin-type N-terminal cleavage/methylation domain-containing protein [Gammaproteobacteria bacterium]